MQRLPDWDIEEPLSTSWATGQSCPHSTALRTSLPQSMEALLRRIFLTQGLNPRLLYLLHAGRFFTAEPPREALTGGAVRVTLYKQTLGLCLASLVAQTVTHLPAMQETWFQSLGWEDPLKKEMVTHSSTLAWKIP